MGRACCCSNLCEKSSCSIVETGLIYDLPPIDRYGGFGWFALANRQKLSKVEDLQNELSINVTFKYNNAYNCTLPNPGNPGPQFGQIKCCFILPADHDLMIRVTGPVETQNAGYDFATILLTKPDDPSFGKNVYISSYGEGGGCRMKNASSFMTFTAKAGLYRYILTASTVDGLYHQDMIHKYEIFEI